MAPQSLKSSIIQGSRSRRTKVLIWIQPLGCSSPPLFGKYWRRPKIQTSRRRHPPSVCRWWCLTTAAGWSNRCDTGPTMEDRWQLPCVRPKIEHLKVWHTPHWVHELYIERLIRETGMKRVITLKNLGINIVPQITVIDKIGDSFNSSMASSLGRSIFTKFLHRSQQNSPLTSWV